MHLVIAVVKRVPSGLDGKRLGEPSGDRTRDPLIKSQVLYRSELTARAVILQGYKPGATSGRAVYASGYARQPANRPPGGRRRSRLRSGGIRVDEKSQIQALDRTQPVLPMRPGHA